MSDGRRGPAPCHQEPRRRRAGGSLRRGSRGRARHRRSWSRAERLRSGHDRGTRPATVRIPTHDDLVDLLDSRRSHSGICCGRRPGSLMCPDRPHRSPATSRSGGACGSRPPTARAATARRPCSHHHEPPAVRAAECCVCLRHGPALESDDSVQRSLSTSARLPAPLAEAGAPGPWHDIWADPEARSFVRSVAAENETVPTVRSEPNRGVPQRYLKPDALVRAGNRAHPRLIPRTAPRG